ncbi:MAG: hypothetical protein P8Y58_08320 [Novosphingobium sp.]
MRQIALPLSAASDSPPRIVVGNANSGVLDALMEPHKRRTASASGRD